MQLRHSRLPLILAFTVLLLAVIYPIVQVKSQTESLRPGFNNAISSLQQAESAGARPSELSDLVVLLNTALDLNRQAIALKPDQIDKRAELLAQVDQILTNVQTRSTELRTTVAQRTSIDRMLTYIWGFSAAILGTICCTIILSAYQRFRIRRTFNMKVTLK